MRVRLGMTRIIAHQPRLGKRQGKEMATLVQESLAKPKKLKVTVYSAMGHDRGCFVVGLDGDGREYVRVRLSRSEAVNLRDRLKATIKGMPKRKRRKSTLS